MPLTRPQLVGTLTGLVLALFLAALDQTIVGTAEPRIIADLSGFDRYPWVATAYLLTSTITVPIVDMVDPNHVSILSGKTQFSIDALDFGGLSFAPYSWAGVHFQQGGIIDNNYGAVNLCTNYSQTIGGNVICSTVTGGVQVTHGEDRANFSMSGTTYFPDNQDGSTFVDNGATCTWTKKDGTKIIYYAFHAAPTTTPWTSPTGL